MPTRLAIGCMTGTSLDALDVSLVEIHGTGLNLTARHIRSLSTPLGVIQPKLRALADQHPMTAGDIAALARDFALLHASAIRELCAADRPHLICIHGQTVFHAPPTSWQLFNPAIVAHELRAPVVSDLRAADLAAGGQGAPITPIADWILLRNLDPSTGEIPATPEPDTRIAVVNLGGFANATLLDFDTTRTDLIRAMDICACNQLLDRIARDLMHKPFDADGSAASSGSANIDAAEDLEGIFASRTRSGRSLGTGDEAWDWVSRHRHQLSPADIAATACEAIATTIVSALGSTQRILLAGGGVKNLALTNAIKANAACPAEPTDSVGIPASYRESICFAILGALCQDRIPITLPQVTGCPSPAPVAGIWTYPS